MLAYMFIFYLFIRAEIKFVDKKKSGRANACVLEQGCQKSDMFIYFISKIKQRVTIYVILKIQTFFNRAHYNHLNTIQVQYSDPHCINNCFLKY